MFGDNDFNGFADVYRDYRPDADYDALAVLASHWEGHKKDLEELREGYAKAHDDTIDSSEGALSEAVARSRDSIVKAGKDGSSIPYLIALADANKKFNQEASDITKALDTSHAADSIRLAAQIKAIQDPKNQQDPQTVKDAVEAAKQKAREAAFQRFTEASEKVSGLWQEPPVDAVADDGTVEDCSDTSVFQQQGTFTGTMADPAQQQSTFTGTMADPARQASAFTGTMADPARQASAFTSTPTDTPQQFGSQQGPSPVPPSGSPAGGGGASKSGVPDAGGGTSAMRSGVLDTPHAPGAPAPSSSGAEGGAGPAPSFGGIGGVGGAPRGGSAPSISGAGGSSDDQGTRASSGQVTEKPAASQPAQGSSPQGSGMRSGGGASASIGGTSAQGGAVAGYREAMRGDVAGGATGMGRHLDARQDALGTSALARSGLAVTTRQKIRDGSMAVQAAHAAVLAVMLERNPSRSQKHAELLAFGNGSVVGGRIVGFQEDGITWGHNQVGDFPATRILCLVFGYENYHQEVNEEFGVARDVLLEVTSTREFGLIPPEFVMPERPQARVMERGQSSNAPAQTWLESDPGRLAVALARWRLSQYEHGSPWKPVVVSFPQPPDDMVLSELAQLGCAAHWPGKSGFDHVEAPAGEQEAEAAARVRGQAGSDPQVQAKRADPLAHAKAAKEREPDGLYDPEGLPAKEASWYQECCDNVNRERLTNRRWLLELEQRYKDERGGEPTFRW